GTGHRSTLLGFVRCIMRSVGRSAMLGSRSRGTVRHAALAAFVALGVLSVGAPASAAVPNLLTHQARTLNAAGTPPTATVNITFTLYDAPSGGTVLWSEVQSVTFDDGYFSVQLGTVTPLPATVFNGATPRYLGMTVAGDSELSPREAVESVPYALYAGDVT